MTVAVGVGENIFKKAVKLLIVISFFILLVISQGVFGQQTAIYVLPPEYHLEDLSDTIGIPSADVTWILEDNEPGAVVQGSIDFPVTFTGFGIGWEEESFDKYEAEDFIIHARTRKNSDKYGDWQVLPGDHMPEENPSGIYWSELFLTPDGQVHDEIEIKIVPPAGAVISSVKISAANTYYPDDNIAKQLDGIESQVAVLQSTPNIIMREQW